MTILNRRSFVAALAASLSSATAAHASGEQVAPEHPDLLAMSDRLPATLQSYKDAAAKVHSIAKTWGPQWPTPDPEIIWYGNGSKRHADILGRGIETPWGKGGIMRVQNIGTPEGFEAEYHAHTKEAERKSKFKSQRGMKSEIRWAERSKAQIEPAHAYWSEVERITAASGIEAAQVAETASRDALRSLVGDILTFEEQSPVGLGIKAQALAAFIELPPFWQMANPDSPKWLAGLTGTLARQANPASVG
ncbi:hypothetical protein [Cognatishimia sp.]|uniref:hypothetical protein n=1 Tax=Cognatishimia sp. TaxID=2211648 RepID=UPI0035124E7E|nr:hypothetical protein [Cognatishimia sp.]NQY60791.1 hypothetical protein [Cognatishimia sp.]